VPHRFNGSVRPHNQKKKRRHFQILRFVVESDRDVLSWPVITLTFTTKVYALASIGCFFLHSLQSDSDPSKIFLADNGRTRNAECIFLWKIRSGCQ
jgi:hypothetical protein